jgi:hypothetical protein
MKMSFGGTYTEAQIQETPFLNNLSVALIMNRYLKVVRVGLASLASVVFDTVKDSRGDYKLLFVVFALSFSESSVNG